MWMITQTQISPFISVSTNRERDTHTHRGVCEADSDKCTSSLAHSYMPLTHTTSLSNFLIPPQTPPAVHLPSPVSPSCLQVAAEPRTLGFTVRPDLSVALRHTLFCVQGHDNNSLVSEEKLLCLDSFQLMYDKRSL